MVLMCMGRMERKVQSSSVLAFFDSCVLRFFSRPTELGCIARSAQISSTLVFFALCDFGSCVLRFLSSSILETPNGARVHVRNDNPAKLYYFLTIC